MKLSKYIVLSALLGACITANATLYRFDYTFNRGDVSMSGVFNGVANGDIIHISDFQSISYSAPFGSYSYDGPLEVYTSKYSGTDAKTSFSGTVQDFSAGFHEYSYNTFSVGAHKIPTDNYISVLQYTAWTTVVHEVDEPQNATWKVTAISAVPEPGAPLMLLAGLGFFTFFARRNGHF